MLSDIISGHSDVAIVFFRLKKFLLPCVKNLFVHLHTAEHIKHFKGFGKISVENAVFFHELMVFVKLAEKALGRPCEHLLFLVFCEVLIRITNDILVKFHLCKVLVILFEMRIERTVTRIHCRVISVVFHNGLCGRLDTNDLFARFGNGLIDIRADHGEDRNAEGRTFLGIDGHDIHAVDIGKHLSPKRTRTAAATGEHLIRIDTHFIKDIEAIHE